MGRCLDYLGFLLEILSLSGESGFLVGERRKRERKLIGFLGRWVGFVVIDGNLEKCVGYISFFFNRFRAFVLGREFGLIF